MKRVHPSGASKRKKKERKSFEIKQSSQSLNLWLAGSSSNPENIEKTQTGNEDQIEPPSIQAEATVATSSGGSENKREETTTSNQNFLDLNLDHPKPSLTHFDRDSSISSDSDSEISDEESKQDTLDASKKNLGCFICPNESDHIGIKKAFMEKHPIQVHEGKGVKLPFDPSKLYYRLLPNGEKIHRKWLSYSIELNKVYCSCCMAFGGKDNRDSTFITGHDVTPKHIYKSLETHENSHYHELAAKTAFQCLKGRDIERLLAGHQSKQREREVHTRRLVVHRLIDIVLFLGRQGIAYRGDKAEGAYSLDSVENHDQYKSFIKVVKTQDEQIPDEESNKAEEILKDRELDSEPESEEDNFRGFCNDKRDLFSDIDREEIINVVASSSDELKRKLMG
ncbi:uncharacterized protein LOC124636005 [Helicoverpa zea]|uniref:uncharacterized protein LOC124636005 n=1 Tax=Helicoverpa zea TaxID=7113 RepID=UPI001F5AE169|nr:uncharacterized protein LOC124636005 [Helicoverpa zea]